MDEFIETGAKALGHIECPCCKGRHEVKARWSENWFGRQADDGEEFAVAWCPEAGREVGDWVAALPTP